MATSISIRSNVMWAITHQKFSCFQRDHVALAACLSTITTQCDEIDPADPDAEPLRLKIKAQCLLELRLANQSAIQRPAAGAIAFLKLGEAEGLLKEDVQAWAAHLEEILICLRRRVQHGMVFAAVLQEWLREKHTAASIKEVIGPSVISQASCFFVHGISSISQHPQRFDINTFLSYRFPEVTQRQRRLVE